MKIAQGINACSHEVLRKFPNTVLFLIENRSHRSNFDEVDPKKKWASIEAHP